MCVNACVNVSVCVNACVNVSVCVGIKSEIESIFADRERQPFRRYQALKHSLFNQCMTLVYNNGSYHIQSLP